LTLDQLYIKFIGNFHIHHDGVPRIGGRHDHPHLGPWELSQGNCMSHLAYRCHAHKLNKYETYNLYGL
jgi:hypothetical protein